MKNKWMYAHIIFLIVLLIIGTFFDYQISEMMSGQWILVSRITEIFGGFPMTILITLTLHIFLVNHQRTDSTRMYFFFILLNLAALIASIANYYVIFRYLNPTSGHSHGPVSLPLIVIAIVLGGLTFVMIQKYLTTLDSNLKRWLWKQSKKVFLFLILVLLLTQGLKTMFARPRYWTVVSGIYSFVPWYTISGPTLQNELMSFISGHTANAYVLVALSWYIKDSFKVRQIVLNGGLCWGFLVGLGRLLSGQHFVTDVSMAGLLVILLFVWIEYKANK